MPGGQIVPIHGFIESSGEFPIQKCTISCKFKNIRNLPGSRLLQIPQAISQTCRADDMIDTEFAEKSPLGAEIN
jgi:hypothetical protein